MSRRAQTYHRHLEGRLEYRDDYLDRATLLHGTASNLACAIRIEALVKYDV